MDTAIIDTTLVTLADDRLGVVDDGAVGIADGELCYVGSTDGVDPGDADRVVDGAGLITMPGLVDAHAHTGYTLLRGGAQDLPEIEWMNAGLGPFANAMSADDRVVGSKLGVLEAVRGGATTVAEYDDRVADLVEAVYRPYGVRVVATETINEVADDRSGLGPRDLYEFDRERGEAAFARANDLFDRYADADLVTPMYGPQALDMVSPDLLRSVRDRAAADDRRVHVHVAQGERERLQIEERYGADRTTVAVLDDLDLLDEFLVAVHCHGTTAAERRRMVEAGASLVGCPSSIAAIDGRVPPVDGYAGLGGTAGLGTDQAPGPGHHNVLREARTASLLSKTDAADPTALPAWRALRLATLGGARALGIDDAVGSLEVGKRADVITVDMGALGVAPTVSRPLRTAIPNLVYSTTGREVRDVFVDGEPLVRDGEFVRADADAVVREANERADAVFDRGTDDWRAAGSALVDRADDGWL
ncbi:amidohydrolase family protein [Candidatus Halobonum tyrrellensis]|uniref:Cytosine deaminase n=1 Tax=Candidatus Halobonum tyrrellensis G22 TaxID=1324957 RepID=V4GYA1_9EURY|nr:amidohydrolase family protein [Candidatus Halobonum tyrrellensis]ESP90166.1 cytosine deaminase [Candidatus Halobonum tyrrellensis G22]